MKDKFYSVDEISTMLKMHVKTIQRYIREGKIKATKIGKAYQVHGHDLSQFLGDRIDVEIKPAKVSTVMDLHIPNKEEAMDMTNILTAALQIKSTEYSGSTLNTMYLEQQGLLRVMIKGNLEFTEIMIGSIKQLIERED